MTGWIKMEKDLLTDPRVTRIASALRDACDAAVTHDASQERHVSYAVLRLVTLGALTHLWMVADTHASEEGLLAVGIDQIDQLIGIQGFCQSLPQQWLQVIDQNNVKFPRFHVHNGTQSKKNAQTAKRMRRHRQSAILPRYAGSVTSASPDQDQDQDHKKKNIKKKIASRLPEDFALTQERSTYAQQRRLNAQAQFEAFRDHWTASNRPSAVKRDWDAAWRTWCRNAPSFAPRAGNGTPDASAEWAEAKSRAAAIGFRPPGQLESVGAYMTAIKLTETRMPSGSVLKRIEAMRP